MPTEHQALQRLPVHGPYAAEPETAVALAKPQQHQTKESQPPTCHQRLAACWSAYREGGLHCGRFICECGEDEPEIIELVVSLVRLCLLCSTTCSYSARSVRAAAWQKEKKTKKKKHQLLGREDNCVLTTQLRVTDSFLSS